MANTTESITCGGFVFYINFDSANLSKVEQVKVETSEKDVYETEGKSCRSTNSEDTSDYEFNLWTKHDCHGTQFQNNHRTWFYFGIKACRPGVSIRLNIVNLNKQVKMFSQGMCPVFKVVPGHPHWERIREKPTYTLDHKGNDFTLSFIYHAPENPKAITYFAFTYPFSYTDLQNYLRKLDAKMAKRTVATADDIYYHRECAIKSMEGRRLDVLTISSYHNISREREDRLPHMFPERNEERPFKFWDKKVIFISARVHPGETPSSFVFNGFLNFLLHRDEQIAINLRRLYVFKLIPMLNPDGVAKGHYRMDTKGVNLNRVYLNPSEKDHPTIYAARTLIRYYHHSYKLPEETFEEVSSTNIEIGKSNASTVSTPDSLANVIRDTTTRLLQQVTLMTLDEKNQGEPELKEDALSMQEKLNDITYGEGEDETTFKEIEENSSINEKYTGTRNCTAVGVGQLPKDIVESGLYLYIDLHGHASKKGVFMYGNYFDDLEDTITCMLLPKLMSINNPNFHFASCNFTERNMYIIDKRDGMSREGSGRVAVYKLTGLVRSYTLECNYNSGRLVNTIPARVRDGANKTMSHIFTPPKYTPGVFEAVGAALGPSILDLTNNNPNSRLPNSQYRSLRGVKSYLKLTYVNNVPPFNKSKDDNGIVSNDPLILKDSKTICDSSIKTKDLAETEVHLGKKSYSVRRTTSLYPAMKRIKVSKKSRQIPARKPLKNQYLNNIENDSLFYIRSEPTVKTFLRASERSKRSNPENANDTLRPQLKGHKCLSKKLMTLNNLSKTITTSEETAIVKQGAKRLKIVSPKPVKSRPEIGESSNAGITEKIVAKQSSQLIVLCSKQAKKNSLRKIEEMKAKKKSSKLKEKNKVNPVEDSLTTDEGTSKILN